MYELHIANKNYSSWSLRPWALLKALEIPFTEHMHHFQPGGQNGFTSFSPSSLVPCLVDGDTTVWDSLAIIEYVYEQYAGAWPAHRTARAFARSAAAEMHSGFQALRSQCSMTVGQRITLKDTPPNLLRDLARIDALWTQGLTTFGGPFLATDSFTAVDAFFAPVVFRIQTYGLGFHLSEASRAYVDRMLSHPVLQHWYDEAIAETVRDADHEVENARAGTVISDVRAG